MTKDTEKSLRERVTPQPAICPLFLSRILAQFLCARRKVVSISWIDGGVSGFPSSILLSSVNCLINVKISLSNCS